MSNTFAKRLKALRKAAGITPLEFARKFNIANGTVGNWESGNRQPDYATVQKIADFFKVSVDYLVREETEETDKKEKPIGYDGLSEKRKALIDFALSVPEDKAEMLLRVMKSIVEGV